LIGRLLEPDERGCDIRRHPVPKFVDDSQIVLGICATLVGGLPEPNCSLTVILRNAFAACKVPVAKQELADSITRFRFLLPCSEIEFVEVDSLLRRANYRAKDKDERYRDVATCRLHNSLRAPGVVAVCSWEQQVLTRVW